jgi:hypothetical protein
VQRRKVEGGVSYYLVEFNVMGEGEPRYVKVHDTKDRHEAIRQALRFRGGIRSVARDLKAGAGSPFDAGMSDGHAMTVMDIRCFEVEDDHG